MMDLNIFHGRAIVEHNDADTELHHGAPKRHPLLVLAIILLCLAALYIIGGVLGVVLKAYLS
jgi:hypothetical protein